MQALVCMKEDDRGRVAIEDLDATFCWTYGELERLAALYARKISSSISSEQTSSSTCPAISRRVAFLVDPGPEYVACTLACWRMNTIAFPLATMHPARELIHYLEDSACDVVVVSACYKERVAEAIAGCTCQAALVVVEEAGLLAEHLRSHNLLPTVENEIWAAPAAEDGCLLLYTSGTTSKPKGVLHTHKSIAAQVSGLITAWRWTCEDTALHCLPLHHIHGIVNILYCALASRARIVFVAKFDARRIVKKLASGDISVMMGVPTGCSY